jgi:hypothetical protein
MNRNLPQSERLKLLRAINSGCAKHPAYKAEKAPKANCSDCNEMWKARVVLRSQFAPR